MSVSSPAVERGGEQSAARQRSRRRGARGDVALEAGGQELAQRDVDGLLSHASHRGQLAARHDDDPVRLANDVVLARCRRGRLGRGGEQGAERGKGRQDVVRTEAQRREGVVRGFQQIGDVTAPGADVVVEARRELARLIRCRSCRRWCGRQRGERRRVGCREGSGGPGRDPRGGPERRQTRRERPASAATAGGDRPGSCR